MYLKYKTETGKTKKYIQGKYTYSDQISQCDNIFSLEIRNYYYQAVHISCEYMYVSIFVFDVVKI